MWKQTLDSFFVTRLLNDITTYFNLYDYLKIKFKENTSGKTTIKNEQDFWRRILGETFTGVGSRSVYEEYLRKSKKGAVWIENAEAIFYLNKQIQVKNFIHSAIGYEISEKTQNELLKIPHLPTCYVYFPTTLSMKMIENN